MSTSRRGVLVGAAALGAVAWGWQRYFVGRENLATVDIPGLPGWKRIDLAGVSGARGSATGAVLVGIGEGDAIEPLPADGLCEALFHDPETGKVPVAVFSDFFCPFCRRLIPRLAAWSGDDISITWHELPLLGPASEQAARAAIAAELQGGYAAYQKALLAAPFRPTAEAFGRAASAAGLQPGKLLLDMNSREVSKRLLETRRAAETLGVYGTPGMVIGRTLVMGEISERSMETLVNEAPLDC